MPHKTSNIKFQNFTAISSTIANSTDDKSINKNQEERKDSDNDLQTQNHQRRLPLPKKLSFEQNITHLLEKESPLLQSELLTTEHELSLFRSRLAVNEGVTAVTGSILESLKDQFESNHKTDDTTMSPYSPRKDIELHSSSMQTSPVNESLPDSIELHYDAETPKSPYILVKAKNSYWVAQQIDNAEVENHMKKFSSPIMKRASIKLPDTLYIDDDSSEEDEEVGKERLNDESRSTFIEKTLTNIDEDNKSNNSISEENESSTIDLHTQLDTMKKIHSSLLLGNKDQFENFEDKIDDVYLIIDYIKHNKLTSASLNSLRGKFYELKYTLRNIHLNKQEELRIEYELDELENVFKKTSIHDDYNFIELFEQNLCELHYIIQQIKNDHSSVQETQIKQVESIKTNDDKQTNKTKQAHNRLIPENPVVTSEIFFEGSKVINKQKKSSPTCHSRLIPEDARISASSFYEGDIHRSLYHHPEQDKPTDHSNKKQTLIPEKPYISSENFYEGDAQRSMFIERSLLTHTDSTAEPPMAIENLRAIMSDLMLVASWSKKPKKIKAEKTKEDVEVLAESFITTEQKSAKKSYCEITHDIENFTVRHPSILIDDQDSSLPEDIEPCETTKDEFIVESKIQDEEEHSISHHEFLQYDHEITDENFLDYSSYVYYDYDYVKPPDSPLVSHVQRSNIISKTITSYPDDDVDYEQEEFEENQFRPTHLDICDSNQIVQDSQPDFQYDKALFETSNNLVERILNDALTEIAVAEQDYLLYQAATQIVNNVIANVLQRYGNNEFNLIESPPSSSSSSDDEIEQKEYNDAYLSSSDDEENEKLIPQISDQPYLFVNDVITSKSTQDLGNLIQELQSLEHKIHDIRPLSPSTSSASSTSLSDNDYQIESSGLSMPKIVMTKSVNELSNLVSELENVEEQLEEKLDSPSMLIKSPISSKSFNELGGLINELNTVSKQLNNRIHEEIFTSTNIEALSQDLVQYRRDSLTKPLTNNNNEQLKRLEYEKHIAETLVNVIIKQAQDIISAEVKILFFNYVVVFPRSFYMKKKD